MNYANLLIKEAKNIDRGESNVGIVAAIENSKISNFNNSLYQSFLLIPKSSQEAIDNIFSYTTPTNEVYDTNIDQITGQPFEITKAICLAGLWRTRKTVKNPFNLVTKVCCKEKQQEATKKLTLPTILFQLVSELVNPIANYITHFSDNNGSEFEINFEGYNFKLRSHNSGNLLLSSSIKSPGLSEEIKIFDTNREGKGCSEQNEADNAFKNMYWSMFKYFEQLYLAVNALNK